MTVPFVVVMLSAPEPERASRKIADPLGLVAVALPPDINTVALPLNWSRLPIGTPMKNPRGPENVPVIGEDEVPTLTLPLSLLKIASPAKLPLAVVLALPFPE